MEEEITFRYVGGSLQPMVRNFQDLKALVNVDPALWAMTLVSISSLRGEEPLFFTMLDRSGDKVLRVDEVKEGIRFLLNTLSDGKGVTEGSSELVLSAIRQTEDTAALRQAAQQILAFLGKADSPTISLKDLQNAAKKKGMYSFDVFLPGSELDVFAGMIAKNASVTPEALTTEQVRSFLDGAKDYLAWLAAGRSAPELAPFGEETAALFADYRTLRPVLDDYFLSCAALAFLDRDPARTAKKSVEADLMAPAEVHAALEKMSLAAPVAGGVLDLAESAVNPRWSEVLSHFSASPALGEFFVQGRLSASAWEALKRRFAAYGKHLVSEPGAGMFSAIGEETLQKLLAGPMPELMLEFCGERERADKTLSGRCELLKLLLFQKNMIRFLNNYANLSDLFDRSTLSILQTGSLVMDGRRFTFVTPIGLDLKEHKRIAATSNICTIYLELLSGTKEPLPLPPVAAAVTSGSMRDLFIGKTGVFYRPDGTTCGARIIDFIEQPVSVSEALKSPFVRFGRFISQVVEKFFAAQSDTAQKNLSKNLSSGLAAAPADAAGKNLNGSMLLMGGGIGIAAIGSSVALIAQALKNVSLLHFLAVVLGIFLIFGGPLVLIASVKLYNRNLGRFLEASGNALNCRIRLSIGMGGFFTQVPRIGKNDRIASDSIGDFGGWSKSGKKFFRMLLAVLAAMLIGGAAGVGIARWLSRDRSVPPVTVSAPAPAPVQPAPVQAAPVSPVPAAESVQQ